MGTKCWGLDRDYYRDPFPNSLLKTRQKLPRSAVRVWLGSRVYMMS